jgi:hypothetical protein
MENTVFAALSASVPRVFRQWFFVFQGRLLGGLFDDSFR